MDALNIVLLVALLLVAAAGWRFQSDAKKNEKALAEAKAHLARANEQILSLGEQINAAIKSRRLLLEAARSLWFKCHGPSGISMPWDEAFNALWRACESPESGAPPGLKK